MGDANTFFWGLIFGAIGGSYFIYGKNQGNLVLLCLGVALCVFPYFITSLVWMLVIGVGLTLTPCFLK